VRDTLSQPTPAPVTARSKQAGDLRQRLTLESSAVWTERMLVTLERGIEGGQWYSLIDKVWNPTHLRLAAWQVIRNEGGAGVDHRTVEQLEEELAAEVALLSQRLRAGTYQPKAVKRVWIPKPGTSEKRPLGIPTVSS
jgi:RNA-directed DNA polymerase